MIFGELSLNLSCDAPLSEDGPSYDINFHVLPPPLLDTSLVLGRQQGVEGDLKIFVIITTLSTGQMRCNLVSPAPQPTLITFGGGFLSLVFISLPKNEHHTKIGRDASPQARRELFII